MQTDDIRDDVREVLYTERQLQDRLAEIAREIEADYDGDVPLLVGVLKGAVMVVSDLARELRIAVNMDWMAVSSYGSGTTSSGVVRILKDLDTDITGRRVLIVEDIIDSGLTLSWLKANLESRGPKSVDICTLFRKPARLKADIELEYVGFDVPDEFVVGYGLDYDERYRNLRDLVVLQPHVYSPAGE
ncbi:MAG: hypoxanthine phosphoribosyltransferase [Pseudoclavibacter sp.]